MSNLQKRILTSIIIFPISIFFILKGGNYIVSFLYAILILGNFEVFSVFKRKNDLTVKNNIKIMLNGKKKILFSFGVSIILYL